MFTRERAPMRAVQSKQLAHPTCMLSQVALHNIWYPYLIYAFAIEFERESKLAGTYFNPTLIAMIWWVV